MFQQPLSCLRRAWLSSERGELAYVVSEVGLLAEVTRCRFLMLAQGSSSSVAFVPEHRGGGGNAAAGRKTLLAMAFHQDAGGPPFT